MAEDETSGKSEKTSSGPDGAGNSAVAASAKGVAVFPVVGIAASAGGLDAFTKLLAHLPVDTGMAFVLVQHLDPRHESMLPTLLQKSTGMPVQQIQQGMAVEPNRVYVIPPSSGLSISDGVLDLTHYAEGHAPRRPIDPFFEALAEDRAPLAIGVVLSGTGSDGTEGMRAIKAAGGFTCAQDDSAQYDGMPGAAIAAGAVDMVLPPEEIGRELARVARQLAADRRDAVGSLLERGDDVQEILALIRKETGSDLSYYKATNLSRRLARRMLIHHDATLAEYVTYLRKTPAEVQALHDDILIGVTEFFRDAEALDALKESALPALFHDRPSDLPVRIWVPGCATGEEAYSLAIVVTEYLEQHPGETRLQIFGTDISAKAVGVARGGVYSEALVAGVSAERLRRYFREVERGYEISKALRERCIFAKHNLVQDPPFSQIDLLSCRNVLIYFRREAQRRVLDMFYYALRPAGLLLLGRSEGVGEFSELFGQTDAAHKLYAKKIVASRGPAHFLPRPGSEIGETILSAAPEERASARTELDELQTEAERLLLTRYAPVGFLINDDADVLRFSGHTGRYLDPAPGAATLNLLKLVREGLQLELRTAIHTARKGAAGFRKDAVGVELGDTDGPRLVNIEVLPVRARLPGRYFLVVLEEAPASAPSAALRAERAEPKDERVRQLEEELANTKEHLKTIIEDLEAGNEELKSANEEVLSANEELQSTNEELETSKEELQSANEEQRTLNEELTTRNTQLGEAQSDVLNLLHSAHVPIVMVGRDFSVRRFTPMAGTVLGLQAGDVGRSIVDLSLPFELPDLPKLLGAAVETLQTEEREVRDRSGRAYLLRVRPYKTVDDKLDGAVLVFVDVDELRRSKAAVEASRDFAESVIDTVREPLVVLDADLRVHAANAAFGALVGYSENVSGQSLPQLAEGQLASAALRELLRRAFSTTGTIEDLEVTANFPGIGERRLVLTTRRLPPREDEPPLILLAIEDVTLPFEATRERERLLHVAEEARIAAERASELIQHVQRISEVALADLPVESLVPEMLARVRAALGDPRAAAVLWREHQGILTARASIGVDEAYVHGARGALNVGFIGRVAAERRIMTTDEVDDDDPLADYLRREHMVRRVGVPLVVGGQLVGVLGVWSRDAAVLDERAVELLRLAGHRIALALDRAAVHARERAARGAAEAANRAKDEFLAMLGHELRNPLGAIANAIRLIERVGHDDPRARQAHAIIARQSVQLAGLVDDLLEVSRVTSGKIMINRQATELAETVEHSLRSLTLAEKTAEHQIHFEHQPVWVLADPTRLEQIVTNLVVNALKYTPAGGTIRVLVTVEEDSALLQVADTGVGMPADLVPRVFELFSQGPTSLDRSRGGLGVGLALVRRLVEVHGGTVEAASEGPGKGSTFSVRLPRIAPPEREEKARRPAARDVAAFTPCRVVLVEDNDDASVGMQILLEMAGHEVHVAADGPSGLDAVLRLQPDVALIDVGLPGFDGYEVARRVRAVPEGQAVGLVALTGYGRPEDRRRAAEAGFDQHLVKPVDPDRLWDVVAALAQDERKRRT